MQERAIGDGLIKMYFSSEPTLWNSSQRWRKGNHAYMYMYM